MKKDNNEYKRNKNEINESVSELETNIKTMINNLSFNISDIVPNNDILPDIEIDIKRVNYEEIINEIKKDAEETLNSLANLYIPENILKTKNIYKIIKEDSLNLAKLNFSIELSQRSMLSCMKQIDLGVNDPEMYQAITMFQKELRESIKTTYELQKKMKDFYKELKIELEEKNIDAGEEIKIEKNNNEKYTIINDPKQLNYIYDRLKEEKNNKNIL